VTITPDEIVNQSITPSAPTGSQVEVPKVFVAPIKEQPVPRTKPQQEKTDLVEVLPNPVSKELVKKGKEKVVITESQQQSFLIALGLSAVALLLASVAAGSQLRSRKRKH
jgi:hypothetical protein